MKAEEQSVVDLCPETEWEDAILEYAIETFPYLDSFEYLPGYEGEEREVIGDLIETGTLKIGFYYEEMQENMIIFYFLHTQNDHHLVLGLDPNIQVQIPRDLHGIFRLDDEQYLDLLQIRLT